MALLELKNIGKIYVSNNNVAVGIRGVNLSFESGEFVAITGKSGSGKSTLLNVISGMDTYEEGELLIEGATTSHYIQSDWEEYRQKYISFIFQDYNIIDNFTVLQNVELALMSTYDSIERRRKALDLINRVGLSKFIHQKGSKLSGGQKQRTVIARALAKDSPIILADEPTGNLDSETSKEIINLLYEVSKNKLVIIVTHNFEQVESYATRHVRVYDGAIESDQQLSTRPDYDEQPIITKKETKKREFFNGLTLGRVMFFSKPMLTLFLCFLMLVGTIYSFVSVATSNGAIAFLQNDYMFNDIDGRVVVIKEDGTTLSDNELEQLKNSTGASSIVHYDRMYDTPVSVDGVNCYPTFNETVGNDIEGRYPTSKNEVFLYLPVSIKEYDSYFVGEKISLFNVWFDVVGCKYFYDNTKKAKLIFSEEGFEVLNYGYVLNNQRMRLLVTTDYDMFSLDASTYISFDIASGKMAIFGDEYEALLKDSSTPDVKMQIGISYTSNVTTQNERKNKAVTLDEKDIDSSFKRNDDYSWYETVVYVNYDVVEEMVKTMLHESYRQASLIYKTNGQAKKAASKISEAEYIAVFAKTKIEDTSLDVILTTVMNLLSFIGLLTTLIFLTFFIYICTSKSILTLKPDMAIMRSMGIKVKTIKVAMYTRMFLALIPGYIILACLVILLYRIPAINGYLRFLHFGGYAIIVFGTMLIAYFVARKHIKKLFKVSVKTSLVGGGEQ